MLLPAGTYLSGSIRLKSNIDLHLSAGCTLLAAPASMKAYDESESFGGFPEYQDGGHTYFHNSLIWADGERNISITGHGMIDGKGLTRKDTEKAGHVQGGSVGTGDKAVALKRCRQVTIRDITIYRGGHFGIIMTGCDLSTIDNVTIDTNRDGLDIDCCKYMTVTNCRINTPHDDALVLKSSYALKQPVLCEHIAVSNCSITGFKCGTLLDGTYQPEPVGWVCGRFKLGTESNGGYRNISLTNCTFMYSSGLAFEEVDQGRMENIVVSNITMSHVHHYPIYITTGCRNRGPKEVTRMSSARDIQISNVVADDCDSLCSIIVTGMKDEPVRGVWLNNIRLHFKGGGTRDLVSKAYREQGTNYPEPKFAGSTPAYGLYARHVEDLHVSDVTFRYERPDYRPAVLLDDVKRFTIRHLDAPTEDGVKQIVTLRSSDVTLGHYKLPVIETTDVHGTLVSTSGRTNHYRLAYIADKANDIRGRGKDYDTRKLLLLDGGDIYQGTVLSNIRRGQPMYAAFDKMDYDAVALGNHEFDWGFETMVDDDATLLAYEFQGKHSDNKVPVLCANLFRHGKRTHTTRDYVVLDKVATSADGHRVGVKIGVIGMADYSAKSMFTHQFTDKGYDIPVDYALANAIADSLERSGSCDATVLLVHGQADEAAQALGQQSVIDLVLGGHSHKNMCDTTTWGLPYLQGKAYGMSYSYAELLFQVDATGRLTFAHVGNCRNLEVDGKKDTRRVAGENAADLEADIVELSDSAVEHVRPMLEKVIGHVNVDLVRNYNNVDDSLALPQSGGRASTMGNWMSDLVRRIGRAEVGFVNNGGVRTSFPLDGATTRHITVSNVYEMFPFDNLIYVYELTYTDFLTLLQYAMTKSGAMLLSRMVGIDCYLTVRADDSYTLRSLVKDGTTVYADGQWTEGWPRRTVRVAVSQFVATVDRVDQSTGLHNPLVKWNNTPRLKSKDSVDNENAVRVLTEEAARHGGLLSVDTAPHFIVAQ
ncbi:MAG: right-handed parallel beta-helix repeat-containing protein [Prevotella sp.]|nr:right-handed parallel beta-helix repeat-containing protein [Prevotella sp.]